MIQITRLNGSKYYVNAELIEQIESTPDTVITLIGGKIVVTKDSPARVVQQIINYKRKITKYSESAMGDPLSLAYKTRVLQAKPNTKKVIRLKKRREIPYGIV